MLSPQLVQALRDREDALKELCKCKARVAGCLAGLSSEERERVFECVRDAMARGVVPDYAAANVDSAFQWLFCGGYIRVRGPEWLFFDRPAGCDQHVVDGYLVEAPEPEAEPQEAEEPPAERVPVGTQPQALLTHADSARPEQKEAEPVMHEEPKQLPRQGEVQRLFRGLRNKQW